MQIRYAQPFCSCPCLLDTFDVSFMYVFPVCFKLIRRPLLHFISLFLSATASREPTYLCLVDRRRFIRYHWSPSPYSSLKIMSFQVRWSEASSWHTCFAVRLSSSILPTRLRTLTCSTRRNSTWSPFAILFSRPFKLRAKVSSRSLCCLRSLNIGSWQRLFLSSRLVILSQIL